MRPMPGLIISFPLIGFKYGDMTIEYEAGACREKGDMEGVYWGFAAEEEGRGWVCVVEGFVGLRVVGEAWAGVGGGSGGGGEGGIAGVWEEKQAS